MREEPLAGGRNASEVVRGPVQPEALIDAMTRSQDRIVRHSEQAVHGSRHPAARRACADEAIRWAIADKELIGANEQTLLAALR